MVKYVVQEHHARHLHYDFRLEMEGILRSWAIPKGPSMNPSEKRLAIQVEDHQLDYIDYEGIIPEGEYGSGAVVIWDSGIYYLIEILDEKITFKLDGNKLKGEFSLLKLKRSAKGNEWLLIKKKDGFAIADWKIELALSKDKRRELEEKTPRHC